MVRLVGRLFFNSSERIELSNVYREAAVVQDLVPNLVLLLLLFELLSLQLEDLFKGDLVQGRQVFSCGVL